MRETKPGLRVPDFKPIQDEFTPATKAACDYTKRPEVAAAPHPFAANLFALDSQRDGCESRCVKSCGPSGSQDLAFFVRGRGWASSPTNPSAFPLTAAPGVGGWGGAGPAGPPHALLDASPSDGTRPA
jgi:hypothetical protein